MGDQQYDGVRVASETTIQIDFQYQGVRCRERLKLKPTPANLKKAARHRAAIIDSIDAGTFDYGVTFPGSKNARKFIRQDRLDHYLRQWLEHKRPTLKTSTYDGYRKAIEGKLIPAFGHLMLAEFKRSHARDWAASLTCTNKRISNLLSPLRTALTDAMYDELIATNPLAGWHYQRQEKVTGQTDKIDPFTPEEQLAILANLPDEGRPLIQFAFWTGLRTSELVALEWNDVDTVRRKARISRGITQASRGQAETPKTAAGIREIDLLPAALDALKQQKLFSDHHESGRVFLNPRTGAPWTGDQAIRKTLWVHALNCADVRYRRQYQTRHTYASMMISAGEPIAWVSRQMGHTSVVLTAQVYSQWVPSTSHQAGSKAVDMFWQLDGNK
ncbi:Arm DNA-binding domain-containing protein [Kushneria sp. Sum13]|uniref:Arm DNA-binding domain-containing protein n=1 Tax=Kushneria sp. Sum13 TaxID=3459196 RepID=UPI00404620C2